MKIRFPLLCLVLISLLLAGCAQAKAPEKTDSVTLWYCETDPLAPGLAALAAGYTPQSGLLSVSLRGFPDEGGLRSALETNRPDLLLCSQALVQELALRDQLRDLKDAPEISWSAYTDDLPGRGRSVFPLGGSLPLLCAREAPEEADLSALFRRAADAGQPYLALDSARDLLSQLLWEKGAVLHGDREQDLREDGYAEAYNLLAEAAYGGGLYFSEAPVDLPCCILDSARLPGWENAGLILSPLPGEAGFPVRLYCLAVTAREGRDQKSISAVLAYLLAEDRLPAESLRAGLIPGSEFGEDPADGPLSRLLLSLGSRAVLPSAPFSQSAADACEQALRQDLLALGANSD